MSSIEAYLDQACGQLYVNPAVATDIRDELRGHLEELVAWHQREGVDEEEALRLALAGFGEPAKLNSYLHMVHHGDGLWARRLKAMALGMAMGSLISLLSALARQMGSASPLLLASVGAAGSQLYLPIGAITTGGLIGLLSARRGGFFVGWTLGSLAWLVAYAAVWVSGTVSGSFSPQESLSAFYGVLLSPILGGLFGAAVSLGSGALLSAGSRLRPTIR